MYARGILFGKMKYELGDHSTVKCPESGLVADIEFKTKGYFGGTYNAIGGFIKDTKNDRNLFELSGLWNEEMYIKDLSVSQNTVPMIREMAYNSGLTQSFIDWKEDTAVRCFSRERDLPNHETTRAARRT